MPLDKKAVGNRISEARIRRRMSRSELAEFIGVSEKFLYEIERGNRMFSLETLVKLCECLMIPSDDILFGLNGKSDTHTIVGMINHCDRKKLPYLEKIVKSFLEAYYEDGLL